MRVRLFVAYQSNERSMFGANKKKAKLYREMRLELLLTPRKPALVGQRDGG